ncbi:response regulator [Deinococcus metallilatus]|uniref:CheY-like chemotaxis protein n=2 Tax=Deinococcus TaxID=1298 RepID=A0AAJ5F0H7_9DEIO|nr:response regulator [Deinococcus metallilatus]MBB5297257.1 CheY-like chemotaxis protein [Deinococcus metallilatus]QBY09673.1 response regulator [Deinococcus metallilatus]RXJ09045.1 response regulator [Deinococcus metallilatus]TLK21300.1 response regulator [Deinococcus metallilatus]GMA17200.1 response regulator [Deinococcus metallilatus]
MERRRILLVDDNPHDVELALNAFQEDGGSSCEIAVAGSGPEALTVLRGPAPLPDLILLDLKMPHMDGLAVLDAIRSETRTRDLPVVMLSTSDEARDIRDSYAHGASGYVIKPLDFTRFREAMHTITAFWAHLNCRPRVG